MKQFHCNSFNWELPDNINLSWQSEEPRWLEILLANGVKAMLSIATGEYSKKAAIENSILNSVVRHGAYLAPMDEEYPDELTLLLDSPNVRVSQHHILRYGNNFAIHLIIKDEFQESDIAVFRNLISNLKPIENSLKDAIGEKSICLIGIEENRFSSMGSLHYLDSEQLIDS